MKFANKKYALIGFPLTQSMSNEFFTDFFRKNNINAQHQNVELEHINDFSKIVSENNFAGFNVTIPYKEKIIPFLDFLDETAQKVGAVNAIAVKNGKLIGYNTDIYGFDKAVEKFLTPTIKNALILGTGGAAKAVKYVLDNKGINSKFVSRNFCCHSCEIRNRLNKERLRNKPAMTINYSELTQQIIENHQVIINAAPVGMLPKTDDCPQIPYEFLDNRHVLFDLICKPEKTLFLQKGEKQGARISNGLQMFNYQAVESYRIWNL